MFLVQTQVFKGMLKRFLASLLLKRMATSILLCNVSFGEARANKANLPELLASHEGKPLSPLTFNFLVHACLTAVNASDERPPLQSAVSFDDACLLLRNFTAKVPDCDKLSSDKRYSLCAPVDLEDKLYREDYIDVFRDWICAFESRSMHGVANAFAVYIIGKEIFNYYAWREAHCVGGNDAKWGDFKMRLSARFHEVWELLRTTSVLIRWEILGYIIAAMFLFQFNPDSHALLARKEYDSMQFAEDMVSFAHNVLGPLVKVDDLAPDDLFTAAMAF